tara:strand:- start:4357 stop:5037 length:681 start_codon:yes stop_codon:yes gene_type:complete
MEYRLDNTVAILTFDDGKANAVGHTFIDAINDGLDKAESEAEAVVLCGREGMFSAGFDLKVLGAGPEQAAELVTKGMAMLTRLYSHPQPLISACTGHAIGMGAFILLASDSRIGIEGDFKVTLPETALGMPFTPVLMSLAEARIAPTHQTAAIIQSRPHSPAEAIAAGFLDELADTDTLLQHCCALAAQFGQYPVGAYRKNKEDLRSTSLNDMRRSMSDNPFGQGA